MLKSIRVTNFKVIGDSSLLQLQPLTALIGRNGSGKSSLIEAITWLSHALTEGVETATEPFQRITDMIRGGTVDPTRTFGLSLVIDPQDASLGDEITYNVEIGASLSDRQPYARAETLSYRSRTEDTILIRTDGDARLLRNIETQVIEKDTKRRITRIDEGYSWNSINDPDRLALASVDPVEHRAGDIVRNYLERAVVLRLTPRAIASFAPARRKRSPRLLDAEGIGLAELLGELDEDTIEVLIEKLSFIISGASDIQAHAPTNPGDRRYFSLFEAGAGGSTEMEIPAWVLSEGTRRMTAILAVLLHDNPPPLLCIEEIENGLDPWTLKFLLDELSGAIHRGTQVILTTHSPYLLDLLGQENIILCDRKDFGVEFLSGDRLPDTSTLQLSMGLGALYTDRFLYKRGAED